MIHIPSMTSLAAVFARSHVFGISATFGNLQRGIIALTTQLAKSHMTSRSFIGLCVSTQAIASPISIQKAIHLLRSSYIHFIMCIVCVPSYIRRIIRSQL